MAQSAHLGRQVASVSEKIHRHHNSERYEQYDTNPESIESITVTKCILVWSFTIVNRVVVHLATRAGWRRGSVVRTSAFGGRIFSDLYLIHRWHVTTSWVKCLLLGQTTRPNQPSIPLGSVNKYEVDIIIRQTRAAYGYWSQIDIDAISYGELGHVPLELGHVEKYGSFYMHNILSSPRLQWWAVVDR